MKPLVTAEKIQAAIREGVCPETLSRDAILTPSAQDILTEYIRTSSGTAAGGNETC